MSASSCSPASDLTCSASLVAARSTETTPIGIEREPPVPSPRGDEIGVALDDGDLVVVEAEMAGDELRIGGGMPLAVGLRADQQRHRPVAVERQGSRLVAGEGAGLDIGGDPEAADLALPLGRLGPRRETGIVGLGERPVEMAGELAAVVEPAALGAVGHLLRPDEIALADLDRAEAGVAAADLDQPLDQIRRLRTSGAAIGVERLGVGVDAAKSALTSPGCRRHRSTW